MIAQFANFMRTSRLVIENRTRDEASIVHRMTIESDVLSGIIKRVAYTLMKGLHL